MTYLTDATETAQALAEYAWHDGHRVCVQCGASLPPLTGRKGRPTVLCDDGCRVAWRNARRRAQAGTGRASMARDYP